MFQYSNDKRSLEPFTTKPAVEEFETGLRLVHGHHVSSTVETHKGKVAVRLDLANLLALVFILLDDQVLQWKRRVLLLSRPLESLGPGLVTKPVADEVRIAGVNQDGNLLKEARNQAVVGLHPITVEEEVAVDVKVTGLVAIDLGTNSFADLTLVQVLANIAHTLVAQVTRILTLATNIVDVLASSLVRTKERVVAVDRSRDANPGTLCVVARLDHRLATRQSVIHRLAAGFVQDSRITTLTASHGAVVIILSQPICEAVANEDGLQVDVALLVGQNLRGKYRDVVTSVRLSSNVEVLLGIFGELLEEKGKEGVDILACSNGVANSGATVRIADIDRLV